jgi:hypothetical protein
VEVARPLTWDLLKNVFNTLNARLLRVEVVSLREDTFYGSIVAEVNGRTVAIDARPSDALALAVRAHVPIYVARSVMQSAGITPEEDMQQKAIQRPPAPASEAPVEDSESESRLSIFEDFLDQLNHGDQEGDADSDKPEKKD